MNSGYYYVKYEIEDTEWDILYWNEKEQYWVTTGDAPKIIGNMVPFPDIKNIKLCYGKEKY